ncbi:MAG TPA: Gfo/Idh/MocA family oxidoreductase [Dehalococcoidia bacterium]|nr:Gfo/Idh/MocA family oxidoreductase [Dehalococcoidia bacterium]
MSGPLRVGFIGAGFIAGVHAGILARDARVRVATVHDPDARTAAAFALRTGAVAAPTADELIDSSDAVYVCTPNALHAEAAVRALAAGRHVFSEKPMATSLADAERVAEAAERARGVYQVGFNRRFAGVYRELTAQIASGALTPTSALFKMNRGELQRPAWTGDATISGGFLYETPVHMLDLVRVLLGDPVEVLCRARSTVYAQPDDFSMLFTFASGASAVLATCAHATWLFPFERVEVYGAHAMAATEEMERVTFSMAPGGPARTIDFAQQPVEERWGYAEEDAQFIAATLGEGEPAVGAAEALRTARLVEKCYAAAGAPGRR